MCVAWMVIKLMSLCRSYGSVRLGHLSCNRLMILRTQMFLYVLIPIPNMPKPECTLLHLFLLIWKGKALKCQHQEQSSHTILFLSDLSPITVYTCNSLRDWLTQDLVENWMNWPLLTRTLHTTLMLLVNMQIMQNIHNMQNMQNIHNMQNSQNMQNRLNKEDMENMQNMQNM